MDFIKTKSIYLKKNMATAGLVLIINMNLYRGCCHGCIYCDSRSNCYPVDNFDIPNVKENALEILENELSKDMKEVLIGIGSMSDTYNPYEKQFEQTQWC